MAIGFMSNTENLCENQNRYKTHIQDFRFIKKDEVILKAKKVFLKVLIACLYLAICGISSNYVFAVFFGNEVRDFPVYFLAFINSPSFFFCLTLIGFVSTSFAIGIHKLNLYAFSSPIRSNHRLDRLFRVAKRIPELERIVKARLVKQGFVSEMDYQSLEIDTIYEELFE